MKKLTAAFSEISVAPGEVFEIELRGVPGAGSFWEVAVASGEARLLGERLVSCKPDMLGGEAVFAFAFAAAGPGAVEIRAECRNAWGTGLQKPQSFKVTVKQALSAPRC
jgi:predicted secreted protein